MKKLPAWLQITFKGRIDCKRYNIYSLFAIFIVPVLSFIRKFFISKSSGLYELSEVILLLMFLYCVLCFISLYIRRLHDLDIKFEFLEVSLLCCDQGTSGPNKYGPDPLEYNEYSDYLKALKNPTADN